MKKKFLWWLGVALLVVGGTLQAFTVEVAMRGEWWEFAFFVWPVIGYIYWGIALWAKFLLYKALCISTFALLVAYLALGGKMPE